LLLAPAQSQELTPTPHPLPGTHRLVKIPPAAASHAPSFSVFSVSTPTALACTGIIWTRWSFVITPVNWNLAAANVFVGCTGLYQLQRVWRAKPADAVPAEGLAGALEPPPPAAGQPPAPPPAVSA